METELFFDIAKNDFPCFLTYEDENDKLNLRGVIFLFGIGRRSWFCRWITRLLVSLGIQNILLLRFVFATTISRYFLRLNYPITCSLPIVG